MFVEHSKHLLHYGCACGRCSIVECWTEHEAVILYSIFDVFELATSTSSV